jgi:hypothetical protein
MIHTTLTFLTDILNEYLKVRLSDPDVNRIFLTSVATESQGIVIPSSSLGLSLINIEEDRIFKDQQTRKVNDSGETQYMNPELRLNLYILISSNFQDTVADDPTDDYAEGLKQLSYIISFFQAKNVFTPENTPLLSSIDPDIEKLIVELYSYSFEQLYNFWTVVGTKYLPSVLYKVRLLKFQSDEVSAIMPSIDGTQLKGLNN